MKKRIVTDTQYPLMRGVLKLLTSEEKTIRLKAHRAWKDSNLYTASDFPKVRTYVILVRVLATGKIGAYDHRTGKFTKNKCSLFSNNPTSRGNRPFTLKEYRNRNGSNAAPKRVNHWLKYNIPDTFKDKTLYDMFIARVGSKKCPIKVKFEPHSRNQVRASFVVR